jgi:hypothetical protein
MTGAAIADGDLIVIRQQPTAENGEVVAAQLDRSGTAEATVKTLRRVDGHTWLIPYNPAYQPIPTDDVTIAPEATSGKTQPLLGQPRQGRQPAPLPARYAGIHTSYVAELAKATMLDDDTRRAHASRVRQYLIWLDTANLDGDPLCKPGARDGARDYRSYLQTVANRKPSTINTVLAAIGDFYTAAWAPPTCAASTCPKLPRAPSTPRDVTRWLRAVERRVKPRDRALALIPFYAGLRLGEVIALDLDDIRLSARKGIVIVRAGAGGTAHTGRSPSTRNCDPTSPYGSMTNGRPGRAPPTPAHCCSTTAAHGSAPAAPTTSWAPSPTRRT